MADAVAVEFVSTAEFPANREKNRDSSILGLFPDFALSLGQSFQDVRGKFPTHRSREFLGKNRDFPEAIKENLTIAVTPRRAF